MVISMWRSYDLIIWAVPFELTFSLLRSFSSKNYVLLKSQTRNLLLNEEKVYLTPPSIEGGLLHVPTMYRLLYPTNFTKPVKLRQAVFGRWICYSNISLATVPFVLSFPLFISVESLKNHSKSQKNHKIENIILLDSTWVDLHSEHIIWYALVQKFCCRKIRFVHYKATTKTLY
jgi:hypothetical protein